MDVHPASPCSSFLDMDQKLSQLIEELTTSGESQLNAQKMKELKKICKYVFRLNVYNNWPAEHPHCLNLSALLCISATSFLHHLERSYLITREWKHLPVGRWGQEGHEFQARVHYRVRPCVRNLKNH